MSVIDIVHSNHHTSNREICIFDLEPLYRFSNRIMVCYDFETLISSMILTREEVPIFKPPYNLVFMEETIITT